MAKKFLCFCVGVLLLFCLPLFSAGADDPPPEEELEYTVTARYAYDFTHDTLLYDASSVPSFRPAATAHMMTVCVALSEYHPDDVVTITQEMLATGGRRMYPDVGDRLTVKDLLYATVCGGYNDAANALAVYIGGSVPAFVERMNAMAASLGMSHTVYRSPTGLDDDGVTTIDDLALLAAHLSRDERYLDAASTRSYTFSSLSTFHIQAISNRCTLFGSYRGLHNFCTSYSETTATSVLFLRGNTDVLLLLIDVLPAAGKTPEEAGKAAFVDALDDALYGYREVTVLSAGQKISETPVDFSVTMKSLPLTVSEDVVLYLPKEENDGVLLDCYIYTPVKAPVNEGDEVGVLTVIYRDEIVKSLPLLAVSSCERSFFLYAMDGIRHYVLSPAFAVTVLSFALLLVSYYFLFVRKHFPRHRHGKREKSGSTKSQKKKKSR